MAKRYTGLDKHKKNTFS